MATKAELVAQAEGMGIDATGTKAEIEARIEAHNAPAVATFEKPVPSTPAVRKGNSTIENPVGVTWVLCLNALAAADGNMPRRKDLMNAARELGVAYYTARTQVQRFMRWHAEGGDLGALPRGVQVGVQE